MHVFACIDVCTSFIPSEKNHRSIADMSLHVYRFVPASSLQKKIHRSIAGMSIRPRHSEKLGCPIDFLLDINERIILSPTFG